MPKQFVFAGRKFASLEEAASEARKSTPPTEKRLHARVLSFAERHLPNARGAAAMDLAVALRWLAMQQKSSAHALAIASKHLRASKLSSKARKELATAVMYAASHGTNAERNGGQVISAVKKHYPASRGRLRSDLRWCLNVVAREERHAEQAKKAARKLGISLWK